MHSRSQSHRFWRSERGNISTILAVTAVPLLLAMGVAVDYSMASNTRSGMQNALDAAVIAALELDPAATKAVREARLRDVYAANGGQGQATLTANLAVAGGQATLEASASYDNPTSLMRLAKLNDVKVVVNSAVKKGQQLVDAQFQVTRSTGLWDKDVKLMGRLKGEATYRPVVSMAYVYNGLGQSSDKGVGNITMSVSEGGEWVPVFRSVCPTTYLKDCYDQKLRGDGSAVVSVKDYDDLYLQMEISASDKEGKYWLDKYSTPRLIKSNDPALSDRMFVDKTQMPKGKVVNIQSVVPCGQWAEHRWEDGGGHDGKTAWEGTDFWYKATGTCGIGSARSATLTK